MMICWNCRGIVVFGEQGWVHADPERACPRLIVAWPPPGTAGDEDDR